jgi:hypothetical protein
MEQVYLELVAVVGQLIFRTQLIEVWGVLVVVVMGLFRLGTALMDPAV